MSASDESDYSESEDVEVLVSEVDVSVFEKWFRTVEVSSTMTVTIQPPSTKANY